jgi:hypothetical protein
LKFSEKEAIVPSDFKYATHPATTLLLGSKYVFVTGNVIVLGICKSKVVILFTVSISLAKKGRAYLGSILKS